MSKRCIFLSAATTLLQMLSIDLIDIVVIHVGVKPPESFGGLLELHLI